MNEPQTDELRFDEHVPFYVNGTLAAQERSWMDNYLAQHPHKRADIDQAHQDRLHSQRLQTNIPESVRLTRLYRELGWSEATVHAQEQGAQAADDVLAVPWLTGVVGVVLGGLLVTGLGLVPASVAPTGQDLARYRGEQINCAQAPSIRLALAPQVQWVNLVQMLRTLQLQVISGPNQDGEIWVRGAAGASTPETLALLRNSPWVEQAIPVEADRTAGPCAR